MLVFTLYTSRAPLSFERCSQVLQVLWEHGMRLGAFDAQEGTWQGQLQAKAYGLPHMTLQQRIALVIQDPDRSITVQDRKMQMELYFDTDLRRVASHQANPAILNDLAYGKISLIVRPVYLHEDSSLPEESSIPSQAYSLSLYQIVHYAVTHWAKVLCDGVNPIFAFSYHDGDYESSEDEFMEHADRVFMAALAKGQLPPIQDWLTSPEIVYVASPFVTASLPQEWLAQPGRQVAVLPNRGLFSVVFDISGDNVRGREFERLGEQARIEKRFADAKAYLLRARAIYENNLNEKRTAYIDIKLRDIP